MVVRQLAQQGLIADLRASTGERVLVLQVAEVERYAGSLILAARDNPRGVPAVEQAAVVGTEMGFPGLIRRLERKDERIVLECVMQLLVERRVALNHAGLLVFPSLFRHRGPIADGELAHRVPLYYDFSGPIDNIYAALVARLALSTRFGPVRMWADRAEFEETGRGMYGLRKVGGRRGVAHLDLYFSDEAAEDGRNLFVGFVEEHLRAYGIGVLETLSPCPREYAFDQGLLRERLLAGKEEVLCPRCDAPHQLISGMEATRGDRQELAGQLFALRTEIERKAQRAAESVKRVMAKAQPVPEGEPIRVLHLSDLHLTGRDSHVALLQPLLADLGDTERGLGATRLDYLVVSGDLADRCNPAGFDRAREFLFGLMERCGVSAERCVLAPGNHDLSRDVDVYRWESARRVDLSKWEGRCVKQGEGYLLRDEERYGHRFGLFAKCYHALKQLPYSLRAEEQFFTALFEETRLQFLGLNSAWQIDEYHPKRAGIDPEALARGLLAADEEVKQAQKEGRLAEDARYYGSRCGTMP